MTSKEKLRKLKELENSSGWNVLVDIMKDEIVQSAMQIAESPNMSLDEINYRRGSIFAAKRLLELPQRLAVHLENEIVMDDKSDKKTDTCLHLTTPLWPGKGDRNGNTTITRANARSSEQHRSKADGRRATTEPQHHKHRLPHKLHLQMPEPPKKAETDNDKAAEKGSPETEGDKVAAEAS